MDVNCEKLCLPLRGLRFVLPVGLAKSDCESSYEAKIN
jgi:hypothetical protein